MANLEIEPGIVKKRKQSTDGGWVSGDSPGSHCLLDVHRRRRQPELNLDATSPFEPRPP